MVFAEPDRLSSLRAYIRHLVEWHTDLDMVMYDREDYEPNDEENPARTDVDQKDPYGSSNMGLKTTRATQHAQNLGNGGRKPGGSNQGVTGK